MVAAGCSGAPDRGALSECDPLGCGLPFKRATPAFGECVGASVDFTLHLGAYTFVPPCVFDTAFAGRLGAWRTQPFTATCGDFPFGVGLCISAPNGTLTQALQWGVSRECFGGDRLALLPPCALFCLYSALAAPESERVALAGDCGHAERNGACPSVYFFYLVVGKRTA